MSEETAKKLEECKAIEAQRRHDVTVAKQALIPQLEHQIRERLTTFAKKVSLAQAGVARKLGGDGIRALRGDLSTAVSDLVSRLSTAVEAEAWPSLKTTNGSVYTRYQAGAIRDEIQQFLALEVSNLASILQSHGFQVGAPGAGIPYGQHLFATDLFDTADDYAELVQALLALADAEAATASAAAADDQDFVSSLWDE